MEELIKLYGTSILIIAPLYALTIRLIFKKSFLAKIGYVLIILAIAITLLTVTFEYLQLPRLLGVPIRLFMVIAAILFLRKDINILQKLSKNLDEISKNNLTVTFDSKHINRKDEFGQISKSSKRLVLSLMKIISNISNTITSVSDASNQLSSASQNISQHANEQASTTEEVASSMEQILAMINSNTQNAEITGKTSEKSATEMQKSNEIFIKTIKSVSEIREKISIITEIADKTDILSINASIEAARSGEVGKGFAVVAHEIRKLADKTKTASDKITELSENAQDISRIAGDALEKVIPEIIRSAKLVGEIVSASREQQIGVENINTSIQQLTEITNENSASAEEMSASAEELSAQAKQLKELISVFKIGNLQNENVVIRQEKQIFVHKNKGFKLDLSNKDKSDDEFEIY